MRKRTLLLALFSITIAGCSTNIPTDYRIPASPTIGLAVGSITYTGALGARQVFLRNAETGQSYRLAVGVSSTLNPFSRPDVDPDIGKVGGLFAIELPPGSYKIDTWRIVQGSMSLSPSTPIEIPFSVVAGESVYLGNFHFEQTARFFLGTGSVDVTLAGNAERDLPALKRRFPVLAAVPVSTAIDDSVKLQKLGGYSQRHMEFATPIFVPVRR